MRWDRACDVSELGTAQRKTKGIWPEPDFVIRYDSGRAQAFNRNRDNPAADYAQRVPFKHVPEYEDWQPVDAHSVVDLLGGLV